jgi:hypothetical protein
MRCTMNGNALHDEWLCDHPTHETQGEYPEMAEHSSHWTTEEKASIVL